MIGSTLAMPVAFSLAATPTLTPSLIRQGAVLTESEGTSTIDQAHKVGVMLDGSNIKILKLVTSEFHIIRAKRCFNKFFKGYVSDIPVSSGLDPVKMKEVVHKETELLEEYARRGWI